VKTISLLPPEIKLSQRTARIKAVLLLIGTGFLLLFFILNGCIALVAQGIEREALQIKQQRSLLQQEIETLQEYAAMQERVETVEKLLEQALGTEPDWPDLLTALSLEVAPHIQLINLSVSYEGDEGELFLRGIASGHDAVASLMEGLDMLPQLENIYCRFTSKTENMERLAAQFEIEALILPGETAGSRKEMP